MTPYSNSIRGIKLVKSQVSVQSFWWWIQFVKHITSQVHEVSTIDILIMHSIGTHLSLCMMRHRAPWGTVLAETGQFCHAKPWNSMHYEVMHYENVNCRWDGTSEIHIDRRITNSKCQQLGRWLHIVNWKLLYRA